MRPHVGALLRATLCAQGSRSTLARQNNNKVKIGSEKSLGHLDAKVSVTGAEGGRNVRRL